MDSCERDDAKISVLRMLILKPRKTKLCKLDSRKLPRYIRMICAFTDGDVITNLRSQAGGQQITKAAIRFVCYNCILPTTLLKDHGYYL